MPCVEFDHSSPPEQMEDRCWNGESDESTVEDELTTEPWKTGEVGLADQVQSLRVGSFQFLTYIEQNTLFWLNLIEQLCHISTY